MIFNFGGFFRIKFLILEILKIQYFSGVSFMISIQDKMIVAENCKEYESKNYTVGLKASYLSNSCSNCVNFVNEQCNKKLFDEIEGIINMN